MKILVIGAEGQVGTFLLRESAGSHQVSGTSMNGVANLLRLDIPSTPELAQTLAGVADLIGQTHLITLGLGLGIGGVLGVMLALAAGYVLQKATGR